MRLPCRLTSSLKTPEGRYTRLWRACCRTVCLTCQNCCWESRKLYETATVMAQKCQLAAFLLLHWLSGGNCSKLHVNKNHHRIVAGQGFLRLIHICYLNGAPVYPVLGKLLLQLTVHLKQWEILQTLLIAEWLASLPDESNRHWERHADAFWVQQVHGRSYCIFGTISCQSVSARCWRLPAISVSLAKPRWCCIFHADLLQSIKMVKLEAWATALPLPIKFESRRHRLQRFLSLPVLKVEKLWFPILQNWLAIDFPRSQVLYVAIDRTSWGCVNLLMISLIWDKRAIPIYFELLPKQGSTSVEEQLAALDKVFPLFKEYKTVILGDWELCWFKLASSLRIWSI